MNSLIVQSILKTALAVGGTALGVKASYDGSGTITIALGVLGPLVSFAWGFIQHYGKVAVPKP